MSVKLLVDTDEFLDYFMADLEKAQKSVWLQTLSFEGDSAGKTIAHQLLKNKVGDIRILVDYFSRYKMSDHLLWLP